MAEILGFYRNYHSRRSVGEQFVIRLRSAPTTSEIAELSAEFSDICIDGGISASAPLPAEVADGDQLELARIVFCFDRMSHGRLRQLIDRLNSLPSAPPPQSLDYP